MDPLLTPELEWLEAELGQEIPPYDWGPAGEPTGRAVRYEPGKGLMITDG